LLSYVLLAQAPESLVQKSHCPTGIENFLSGQRIVRFRPVAFVTTFEIERNKLYVPSSFLAAPPVELVRKIVSK
jgi:hypothetical protein